MQPKIMWHHHSAGARPHKTPMQYTYTQLWLDNALIAVYTIKVQGMHGTWQQVRLPQCSKTFSLDSLSLFCDPSYSTVYNLLLSRICTVFPPQHFPDWHQWVKRLALLSCLFQHWNYSLRVLVDSCLERKLEFKLLLKLGLALPFPI